MIIAARFFLGGAVFRKTPGDGQGGTAAICFHLQLSGQGKPILPHDAYIVNGKGI